MYAASGTAVKLPVGVYTINVVMPKTQRWCADVLSVWKSMIN